MKRSGKDHDKEVAPPLPLYGEPLVNEKYNNDNNNNNNIDH